MAENVSSIPPTITRYRVPRNLLGRSAQALRDVGGGVKEAVILWQGRVVDHATAEVTRLIVPRQVTGPLHFNVPLAERLRILREIATVGEFILVQLHTHPKEAFHSEADDTMAITKHSGAISVVIADFGTRWNGTLSDTAVFVHRGAAKWQALSRAQVDALFEVV